MDAVKLCYIGAGGFSNACIYPQLHRHPLRLAAVCDLVEDKALDAQRKYGFERVYTDFHAMLDAERPDAVICIGGPKVHYAVGMQVLDRGIPLYVQKSPADTAAQVREMADLASGKGVVCHVGFNIRSSVAVQRAREATQRPDFGLPNMMIFRYGLCFGATLRDVVMDQHCHATDTVRYLMGDAEAVAVERGRCEGITHYAVMVRFTSGAVGTISFTEGQQADKEFLYFEITGQNGHFLISHDLDLVYRKGPAGEADEVYTHGTYGYQPMLEWYGYVADLANFVAAVQGEAPDRTPIADTVGSMELCEEIYRQLREAGAPE
jgi:predicted dehydrogenase